MRGADDDRARFVVVGHAGRDLVLEVGGLPEAGGSTEVRRRIERLGGKGASIAVGLRQLAPEAEVVLVAALGDDDAGARAVEEARALGVGTARLARRGTTALLVDVVDDGERRLLEDVTDASLVTVADVEVAAGDIRAADLLVLQLQQPVGALLAAARIAADAGVPVLLDGAVEGDARDALVGMAAAVRADAAEAELLLGRPIESRLDAEAAAASLLERGPRLVALAAEDGDVVAWHGGARWFPHGDAPVVDPTGAGDAFVAGIAVGLVRGDALEEVGGLGAAAATAAVQRLGGHPELAGVEPERGERAARPQGGER
ncbi:PfkB family carbohydrate kinase [Agrococcus terreus]|uniref:Ribokinase n=1 Tax=Agrococcus terreus TaxID=574649 RepID=A0ABQ2KL99_9MICO|nr:PfkB family carbohydrate kinase [Agrococcus terreus]GGN84660.1 ribokinase [Agrococcus terreus]